MDSYLSTPNYQSSAPLQPGDVKGILIRLLEGGWVRGKEMVFGKDFNSLESEEGEEGFRAHARRVEGGRVWKMAVGIARTAIISMMERITIGQLRVLTPEGIYTFGEKKDLGPHDGELMEKDSGDRDDGEDTDSKMLKASLKVVGDAFWLRMIVLSDLGFAEAYMVGDVECDDLSSLFRMFIVNRKNLSDLDTVPSHLFRTINYLMNSRFVNSISNSISNISAHYDISNKMFESFLSRDLTYSCAIFGLEEGGPNGDLYPCSSLTSTTTTTTNPSTSTTDNSDITTFSSSPFSSALFSPPPIPLSSLQNPEDPLERAQIRKLHHIIARAKIRPGHRILEIGSGWGSFSIECVKSIPNCTVDTLTLSIEQKHLAEERIREAGLEKKGRIKVHLIDYRKITESVENGGFGWENCFDRVVSVEMLEAVGLEYLETYFEVVEKVLKKDGGVGVFQCITIPESRFDRYKNEIDFIRKYLFPGGILPTLTLLTTSITNGSSNRLLIDSVDNIGPHYARTLREWSTRFQRNFEMEIVPTLMEAYPELRGRKQVEIFRKKWIYYFHYCESGFALRVLNNHIITVTREGNLSLD